MNSVWNDILGANGDIIERQAQIDDALRAGVTPNLNAHTLTGFDLSGLDLLAFEMRGVNIRGAVCNGTRFPPLDKCDLASMEADHAYFPSLVRCRLHGASLGGAVFGPQILECDFTDASLPFARFVASDKPSCDNSGRNCFDGAFMHGADGAGKCLREGTFCRARLSNARLSRADLTHCDFRQAILDGTNLVRSNTRGCLFEGALIDTCYTCDEFAGNVSNKILRATGRVARFPLWSYEFAAIRETLIRYRDINIKWMMRQQSTGRIERLIIWRDEVVANTSGAGAISVGGVPIRAYGMLAVDQLAAVLIKIVADYADWTIEETSVEVQTKPSAPVGETKVAIQAVKSVFNGSVLHTRCVS